MVNRELPDAGDKNLESRELAMPKRPTTRSLGTSMLETVDGIRAEWNTDLTELPGC